MVGCWLLAEPLDAITARRYLHRLAAPFGLPRDSSSCEPELTRFAIPNTQVPTVIPSRRVAVETFEPGTCYTVELSPGETPSKLKEFACFPGLHPFSTPKKCQNLKELTRLTA